MTHALVVAATLLVVAGMTARIVRAHLESSLDAELAAAADSFQRSPAMTAPNQHQLAVRARAWLATQPLPAGEMAAIRAGQLVQTSAGARDFFEVRNPGVLLSATEPRWLTVHGREGPARALTLPIRRGDRQVGTFVLLGYRNRVEQTLGALLAGVAWASALGLAFAVALGAFVLRRNLRPLQRMTHEVETIERTSDLSRRIGSPEGKDEVARLAGAFDRMLARLESVFGSQRRFIADAAHELRTPLTVIRGQLELVGDGPATADQRRSIETAFDELDRIARTVEELLMLARLDEGMKLAREPVEVELVLREALLRVLLTSPREVHVEAEPGLYALADPDRLLQVITNLVQNAVRYTDPDSWVSLNANAENDEVVINVSDDGPGIPPEDLPHIFERLYRGRGAHGSTDGAGLGLAIVASLVEAMGGTVAARSTDGAVTTFTVRLPLAQQAAAVAHGR